MLLRVVVVDDSALMRRLITDILEADREISVVATARNGDEALDLIPELRPDVVTLDVEMPGLNGMETLKRLMHLYPVPVIMVSALTREGAEVTLEALDCGAVDFVAKPGRLTDLRGLAGELVRKVKMAASVSVNKLLGTRGSQVRHPPLAGVRTERERVRGVSRPGGQRVEAVTIAASTGGPAALRAVIPELPSGFPAAVVVVQHMPPGFTRVLAQRLQEISELEVKEAEHLDDVVPGRVLIAPAGFNVALRRIGGRVKVEVGGEAVVPSAFRPSADGVMISAAEIYGHCVLGVVLTGMGNDGVRGLAAIKREGGVTLAEDESSCIVFGMPRAAWEAGVVDRMVPLSRMPAVINGIVL